MKSGFIVFLCCLYFINLYAIDVEPIDVFEDTSVECAQPCNRFSFNFNAENLTTDTIDSTNGDIIDFVFIVIRDADCNLVGTHLGEFRSGHNIFGFVSTIGGPIVAPEKLPLTAYLVDFKNKDDIPQNGNYDELNPFAREVVFTEGTFNNEFLESVVLAPNCYPLDIELYSYGEKDFNEFGKDLIQTSDGGFLLVGFTEKPKDELPSILGITRDVEIKRINSEFQELWSIQYGGIDHEGWGTDIDGVGDIDVIADIDGAYIVATSMASATDVENPTGSSEPNPWVFKINDSGEILWDTQIQADGVAVFHDMVANPSGGCYISFNSASATYTILEDSLHSVSQFGDMDIAFSHIDENGVIQWVHAVGDQTSNLHSAIDLIADNSLIVLYGSDSREGVQAANIDTNGNVIWNQTFGNFDTDRVTEVIALSDGSYIGAITESEVFPVNLRLIKFTDSILIWDRQYDTPFDDYIFSILPLENGNNLMVGESNEATLLMVIDTDGNLQFKERLLYDNDSRFGNIIQTNDGYAQIGTVLNDVSFDGINFDDGHQDFFIAQLERDFSSIPIRPVGLNGSVKNINGVGIPEVELRLSNGAIAMTDLNGNYSFLEIDDFTNLTLNLTKFGDLQSGLSSVDLVQVLNHIIGNVPFTNQLKIASSDLNNDGQVSSADLIILRNVILGLISALPNDTPVWRFSENHIPITESTESPLDIIANKVGDANGDAIK